MNSVEPPRHSRRRAAVYTVAGLIVAGVVSGVLWAWLAPPVQAWRSLAAL